MTTYSVSGSRLKRAVTVGATTSSYFGDVEILNAGSTDIAHWYLHPNVRVTHEATGSPTETYLHRDQLSSVVLVANAAGGEDVERIFAPFGVQTEYVLNGTSDEDVGFIGERLDAVAGLQYLNARYYDPELGLFTQPDWLEVSEPGVGTNRYAYSRNDPVNLSDPGGNATSEEGFDMSGDMYSEDDEVRAPDFPDHILRDTLSERQAKFGNDVVWDDKETGFYARSYSNTKTGETILGFRGTDDKADLVDDAVYAATGQSPQTDQAIALAHAVRGSGRVQSGPGGLSYTGHSLGGGLANVAALSFQRKDGRYTQTYNPQGITVRPNTIVTHIYDGLAGKNANMFNHVVTNGWFGVRDPVSGITASMPHIYNPGNVVGYNSTTFNPTKAHQLESFEGRF